MSTWEEAEAEAWVLKEMTRKFKENETTWSEWKSTVIIIPKTSIYGKLIWGNAYQRENENERVEYATEIEVFKHKMGGMD